MAAGEEKTKPIFVSIIHDKIRIITLVLSILAIVLSQIRPIYQFFEDPEIETTVNIEDLRVRHYFGHLVFEQLLQVKNTGKADGIVSQIDYYIEKVHREGEVNRDKKFRNTYKVQTQRYGENFSSTYPILDISLNYGSLFDSPVIVYETLEQSQQDECRDLWNKIYSSIEKQENEDEDEENYPYAISDTLENKVVKLIDNNLNGFTYGDYKLLVVAYDKHKQPITPTKYYTFKVLPGDIDKLKKITNDYKFGRNGIYYPTKGEFGFSTKLTVYTDKSEIEQLMTNLKNSK